MSASLSSARSAGPFLRKGAPLWRDPRWSRARLVLSDLIMLPGILLFWKHSPGDQRLSLAIFLIPLALAVHPTGPENPPGNIPQNVRLALAISLLFVLPAIAFFGLSAISFFQAHTTLGALLTWLMLLLTEIPVYRRLPKFSK